MYGTAEAQAYQREISKILSSTQALLVSIEEEGVREELKRLQEEALRLKSSINSQFLILTI